MGYYQGRIISIIYGLYIQGLSYVDIKLENIVTDKENNVIFIDIGSIFDERSSNNIYYNTI